MLIKTTELNTSDKSSPSYGISKKYMKEKDIVPADEYTFEFDFKISRGNYIAVCEAFMFGYGNKNDDHHIQSVYMAIQSEITGSKQNSIKVTALCDMFDGSGHLMTVQGRDNSYVRVGVIALPDDIPHGRDDESVEGLTGFVMTFGADDHHLQEIYVNSMEGSGARPVQAYMLDDSNHKAEGKLFATKLGIPKKILQRFDPSTVGSWNAFCALRGFYLRNDKGDTHIRQLGVDFSQNGSDNLVLRDKHSNHASSSSFYLNSAAYAFMK